MRDVLSRIAADGSAKLVVRTVPTIVAERAAGRVPVGAATTVAAWVLHLRGAGAPIKDVNAEAAKAAAAGEDLEAAVRRVLDYLRPGLGSDDELVEAVIAQTRAISSWAGHAPEPPTKVILRPALGSSNLSILSITISPWRP